MKSTYGSFPVYKTIPEVGDVELSLKDVFPKEKFFVVFSLLVEGSVDENVCRFFVDDFEVNQ